MQDLNELWNGTSWTEVADINTARDQNTGVGTSTAGLLAGGETGGAPHAGETESWDGSSWTELGDLNTDRVQAGGSGVQTLAIVYGGYNQEDKAEEWNGTTWTEVADLSTGRSEVAYGSQGTQAACMCTGGSRPGSNYYNTTELFTQAQNVKVITD